LPSVRGIDGRRDITSKGAPARRDRQPCNSAACIHREGRAWSGTIRYGQRRRSRKPPGSGESTRVPAKPVSVLPNRLSGAAWNRWRWDGDVLHRDCQITRSRTPGRKELLAESPGGSPSMTGRNVARRSQNQRQRHASVTPESPGGLGAWSRHPGRIGRSVPASPHPPRSFSEVIERRRVDPVRS
jgi:hypothetical protein